MTITRQQVLKAAEMNDNNKFITTVKKYIEEGGDVNIQDKKGNTLFELVISNTILFRSGVNLTDQLALSLINNGANVSKKHDDQEFYRNLSALHDVYMLMSGKSETFKRLLSHPQIDVNATFDEGNASDVQHFGIEMYYSNGRRYNDSYGLENLTILHFAAVKGDYATVEILCKTKGVNINATCDLIKNKQFKDQPELYKSRGNDANGEHIKGVWVCREAIDIYQVRGVTPLHLAARAGHFNVVMLLTKMGANINAKDSVGKMPHDYCNTTIEEFHNMDENETSFSHYLRASKVDSIKKLQAALKQLSLDEKESKKGPKKRLLVGEGTFSYVRSLLNKHANKKPRLAEAITATEYTSYEKLKELNKLNKKEFEKTIDYLKEQGVKVLFGIDGRKIDKYDELKSDCFKRIHFNFPHDKKDYKERTLPKLLAEFFISAHKMQNLEDRIYIALPKPSNIDRRQFYQAYIYNIYEASARAGYVLFKKRKFDKQRYPGYVHSMTQTAGSASVAEEAREYIFEKTNMSYNEILSSPYYKPGGKKIAYGETNYFLQEINTDSDSSDYSDTEDDKHSAGRIKKVGENTGNKSVAMEDTDDFDTSSSFSFGK